MEVDFSVITKKKKLIFEVHNGVSLICKKNLFFIFCFFSKVNYINENLDKQKKFLKRNIRILKYLKL